MRIFRKAFRAGVKLAKRGKDTLEMVRAMQDDIKTLKLKQAALLGRCNGQQEMLMSLDNRITALEGDDNAKD